MKPEQQSLAQVDPFIMQVKNETNEEKNKRISKSINTRIREKGLSDAGEGLPVMNMGNNCIKGETFPELEEVFERAREERSTKNPFPKGTGSWEIFESTTKIPPKGRSLDKIDAVTGNGSFLYTALRNPCTYDFGDSLFFLTRRPTDALTASCVLSITIIDTYAYDRERLDKWLTESEEHFGITKEEPSDKEKDFFLAYAICAEAGVFYPEDYVPCEKEFLKDAEASDEEDEEGNKKNRTFLPSYAKRKAENIVKKLSALREKGEEGKHERIEIIREAYPDMVHAYECVKNSFGDLGSQEVYCFMESVAHAACEAMMFSSGMVWDIIGRSLIALTDFLETLGAEEPDKELRRMVRLYEQTSIRVPIGENEEIMEWVDAFEESVQKAMQKVPYVVENGGVRVFYSMLAKFFTGCGIRSSLTSAGHDAIGKVLSTEKTRKKIMCRFIEAQGKRERGRVEKAFMESIREVVSIIRSKMENPERRYRAKDVEIWKDWFMYLSSVMISSGDVYSRNVYQDGLEEKYKAEKVMEEAERIKKEALDKASSAHRIEKENEELRRRLNERTNGQVRDRKERNRKLAELTDSLEDALSQIEELKEERRRNRKEIDALTKAFSEFESETGGAEEVSEAESEETKKTAERLDKKYKGIFIGGHQGFLSRLMSLYPSWKSYSYNDKAKMDPGSFKNAEVIVIFAEHLSHSVLFECKKYMKASDAVPVYTFTTNLDAITEKIAQTLEPKSQ